jgi:ATP-grasp domain, R2K clade family 3
VGQEGNAIVMEEKFKDIQWVVQRNLTSRTELAELRSTCLKIGIRMIELDIIPFTDKLPDFDRSRRSIIYGSTTFNALAFNDATLKKGLFFDDISFSIQNYIQKWGRYMLNYNAEIVSFKELINGCKYDAGKLLFIRPDNDSKSFAGEVKRFDEISEWYEKLTVAENINLSPETKIVITEPYSIQYEWRLWIVDRKVVAASKYRAYFKLTKEEGCPADVVAFAEERCEQYTPHDIFVMDICLCGDEYFIVECGCMNGAGFYKANIGNIVSHVSNYFVSAINA